jgi:hypothetical protein
VIVVADTSPAVGITEAVIEAAAAVIYAHTGGNPDSELIAREAVGAALAGRTPLELPQSTGKWSDGVPYWDAENRVVAAQVDDDGRPYTRLNGQIWLVTEAEAVGLALVAAAREARKLASGSSKGGDPNGQ